VSRYQKGKTRKVKTNLDLLEQEIVSGSGICWAICKSTPHPRQPRQHPTTQFFYRPDALPAAEPTASKHWWHINVNQYCVNHFMVLSLALQRNIIWGSSHRYMALSVTCRQHWNINLKQTYFIRPTTSRMVRCNHSSVDNNNGTAVD